MVTNKIVYATVRTTAGRKRDYKRVASREGLRLSEWLRRAADRAFAEAASPTTIRDAAPWAERYREFFELTESLLGDATVSADAVVDIRDRHELLGHAIRAAALRIRA